MEKKTEFQLNMMSSANFKFMLCTIVYMCYCKTACSWLIPKGICRKHYRHLIMLMVARFLTSSLRWTSSRNVPQALRISL